LTAALILVLGILVTLAGLVDIFVQGQLLWGALVTLAGLLLIRASQ
jgi:hypothetical protein